MNKATWTVLFALVVFVCAPVAAVYAGIMFDFRDKVNILNSDNVLITAKQTDGGPVAPAAALVGRLPLVPWDGATTPPGGQNAFTLDFKETRNIKTIEMTVIFGDAGDNKYLITEATVETSNNGVTWTPQSNTLTGSFGSPRKITLDSAVDAQFLRITGTAYDQPADQRWLLTQMRVFGAPGTLDAGEHLDLVASTAFIGGQVLTRNGTVTIVDSTDADFINDAVDPQNRGILADMSTGDGFTLQFDRAIMFTKFGMMLSPTYIDTGASFLVETSMNGVDYTSRLSHTGVVGFTNFFDLTTPGEGKYFRLTWTAAATGNIIMSEVFVFGSPYLAAGTVILIK